MGEASEGGLTPASSRSRRRSCSPTCSGGAGVYYFNPRGDDAVGVGSETNFGLNLGAGIEVKPRNIGFFAETTLLRVIESGDDIQFGAVVVGVRFGPF